MNPEAWIALLAFFGTTVITIIGAAVRMTWSISHQFTKASHDRENQLNDLKEYHADLLNNHEREDQRRHTENIQRLTRLETMVNGSFNARATPHI
jgi:hypothetical protein